MGPAVNIKHFKIVLVTAIASCAMNLEAQKGSARGDKYYDVNLYTEAIRYYQMDIRSRKKKVAEHAMERLADCYRITGNFVKAEQTYEKILKKRRNNPANFLNYGISLKNSAKYAEAKLQFEEYLKLKPGDPVAKLYVVSCDSAQKWLDETIGKEVKNLQYLNTPHSDFAPSLNRKEELVFSSTREGTSRSLISFNGGRDVRRLDLFTVKIKDIEEKKRERSSNKTLRNINTPLHEGASCYSANGNEMYFTKTIKGKKRNEKNVVVGTLQVFYSATDSNGKWSHPRSAFDFNSLDYSVGHPSISKDGNTIFFMSDRAGGFGGSDIYFSRKQNDGSWGPMTNAGKFVNTFGHELFPTLFNDTTLYFSSDGHPGMGQLDILKSRLENGKWTNAVNLKPPVNSVANDFAIIFHHGAARGFFSSDRFNGKGQEDIYSFSEELPMEIMVKNDTLVFADLSVFDDVKYKLNNETNSKEVKLLKKDGYIYAKLDADKTYLLDGSRYGMVYNQVLVKFSRDTAQKFMTVKVAASHKTLKVSGGAFVGIKDQPRPRKSKSTGNYSSLSSKSFSDLEMAVDKKGYFTFSANLEPGKDNVINSRDVTRYRDDN
jgi:hypothetical protein